MIFSVARRVRFQDIDAAGILFFARAFEYFHDTYLALLEARGIDVPRVIREGAWGAPLGHAEADFSAPMRYGDPIRVAIERGEIGRSSLSVFYRVHEEADPSRVFCTGKMVHVFIDVATRRPRAVPDDIRVVFEIH